MPSPIPEPPDPSRTHDAPKFHLLLALGGTEDDFSELVAANGVIRREGDWWVSADEPLAVSSVEVDARLARWSRHTGRLAIRVTRTDDIRWWLAVHHAGRRLAVLIYKDFGAADRLPLTGAQLGRDPLIDVLTQQGMPSDEVQFHVARQRAAQLSAAFAQGDVAVPPADMEGVLGAPGSPANGNLQVLLDLIGARGALSVLQQLAASSRTAPTTGPQTVQAVLGRALLLGCAVPVVASSVLFVIFSRVAMRMGLGGLPSLALGVFAAWLGLVGSRQLLKRLSIWTRWSERTTMAWATDNPAAAAQGVRASPVALNTWGGLFYLLRDIAFFGGIDRPDGPTSLYLEAWAIGPPELVEAINRAAALETQPEWLLDAASALVQLRDGLIQRHLEGDRIAAASIRAEVKAILRTTAAP